MCVCVRMWVCVCVRVCVNKHRVSRHISSCCVFWYMWLTHRRVRRAPANAAIMPTPDSWLSLHCLIHREGTEREGQRERERERARCLAMQARRAQRDSMSMGDEAAAGVRRACQERLGSPQLWPPATEAFSHTPLSPDRPGKGQNPCGFAHTHHNAEIYRSICSVDTHMWRLIPRPIIFPCKLWTHTHTVEGDVAQMLPSNWIHEQSRRAEAASFVVC